MNDLSFETCFINLARLKPSESYYYLINTGRMIVAFQRFVPVKIILKEKYIDLPWE